MRRLPRVAWLVLVGVMSGAAAQNPQPPGDGLAWAYPKSNKSFFQMPTGKGPFHVPGSALSFNRAQVLDDENPVDWFPSDHPPPPQAVSHMSASGATPCAECHLYNGQGFLSAADLNGLSAPYIIQQVRAFRSGERRSAETDRPDTAEMIKVAVRVTDADLVQAAAYFAALKRAPRLHIQEVSQAPVTKPDRFGWLDLIPNGGREPIGLRIIEVSKDMQRLLLGDDHIEFIDYVPLGAPKRGEALVRAGGPGGQPCRSCHGADLRGVGDVPPLAGRSAPYLARMLWDMKSGARTGLAVAQMQAPVRNLTQAQITDISAYLASLKP